LIPFPVKNLHISIGLLALGYILHYSLQSNKYYQFSETTKRALTTPGKSGVSTVAKNNNDLKLEFNC